VRLAFCLFVAWGWKGEAKIRLRLDRDGDLGSDMSTVREAED
jgi:hypothetical protein